MPDDEQPDPADRRQQGVPHAHDGLFRLVFGKPAHAASELRAVLPPELTARLDLNQLTPVNGSFVDSALRWRHSDVTEDLESFLGAIRAALHSPDGTEILQAVLTYIHAVTETPADSLQQVMAQLGPEAEEVYMSTADVLRAEGEARGEAKGRAEALAQLLTLKFGTLPDTARSKLRAASTQQLAAWTERVLDAATVDDVFA